jgi:hypothetical protein
MLSRPLASRSIKLMVPRNDFGPLDPGAPSLAEAVEQPYASVLSHRIGQQQRQDCVKEYPSRLLRKLALIALPSRQFC